MQASTKELKPEKVGEGSMAFMFETYLMLKLPKFVLEDQKLDLEYFMVSAKVITSSVGKD